HGGGADGVVAGAGVDRQHVVRRLCIGDDDLLRQPGDRDRGSGRRHADLVVLGSAVDRHGVGRTVAGGTAGTAGEIDRNLRHAGSGQVADRDVVGAVAADQQVGPVAAGDRVVAGAAVEREVDQVGETVAGRDHVVAAIG